MKKSKTHAGLLVSYAALGLAATMACSGGSTDDGETNEDTAQGDPDFADTFKGRDGTVETTVIDTPYGHQSLTYLREEDGKRVFQGDIVLPEDGPEYRSGGVSSFAGLWPNGIVPFESTGLFNDTRVRNAIAHWQARVPVTFVGGATTGNRLRFVTPTTNVCNANYGMIGGAQDINLAAGCTTGGAIHEIGHVLGLFHEQSRTDRGSFVTVNTGCILPGKAFNFDIFGTDGFNLGVYEIGSIMHYGSTAFLDTSKPGCTATITRLNGTTFTEQRTAATGLDVAGVRSLYQAWTFRRTPTDYDLDGNADLAVWRPSDGTWYVINSTTGVANAVQWGLAGDVPVSQDYDGDGRGDRAVWRPSDQNWYITRSSNGTNFKTRFGKLGDLPVPGNYDGDSRNDLALFRPSDASWNIVQTSDNNSRSTIWGQAGDVPVPGNYDGDTKTDIAVWRPSDGTWRVLRSKDGQTTTMQWGLAGDFPVPADYDGDLKTDFAVWRPSDGKWYVIRSSDGVRTTSGQWGLAGDIPVPADYNRDRKAELAVWRPSNGHWYIIDSIVGSTHEFAWGLPGDVPVP